MKQQVIRRIKLGFNANVYGQVVTIIINIIGIPILLKYWGINLYGEWLILFTIPAYLTICDIGFSQSAANDMALRLGGGDRKGVLMAFQSFRILIYCLVAVALSLTILFVIILPIHKWIHFSVLNITEIRWIILLLAIEVMLKIMEGIWHAALYSSGHYPLSSILYTTTLLIQFISIWLCAAVGYGPTYAVVAFLFVRLIAIFFVKRLTIRYLSWFETGFRSVRLSYLKTLVRPAMANLSLPLADAFNLQGMLLVIATTIGPVGVVTFATLRTLTRLIVSFVRAINNAVQPELALSHGLDNKEAIEQIYIRSIQISFWFSICAALILIIAGSSLLHMWTMGKVVIDYSLFYFLIMSALMASAWSVGLTLLRSANVHLRAAILYVITSISSVLISGILLHYTGIISLAGVVLFAMNAFLCFYILHLANAFIGMSMIRILHEVFEIRSVIKMIKIGAKR